MVLMANPDIGLIRRLMYCIFVSPKAISSAGATILPFSRAFSMSFDWGSNRALTSVGSMSAGLTDMQCLQVGVQILVRNRFRVITWPRMITTIMAVIPTTPYAAVSPTWPPDQMLNAATEYGSVL